MRALGVRDVVTLDPQWRALEFERVSQLLQRLGADGDVACPRQFVAGERLLGVEPHGVRELGFVAAARRLQADRPSPAFSEPFLELERILGQPRNPYFRRDGTERGVCAVVHTARGLGHGDDVVELHVAVDLQHEVRNDLGQLKAADLVAYPRLLAADPAAADVEDLHGRFDLVEGDAENVDVKVLVQNDDVALVDRFERRYFVAQPGGRLVFFCVGRLEHPFAPRRYRLRAAAFHESDEAHGRFAMLFGRDLFDARRAAFSDVSEQAGAAQAPSLVELAFRARTHGEHAQQLVERFAYRPHFRVRAEVARSLPVLLAGHPHPGIFLAQRDRQVGIGLVVAENDVEGRRELFDPQVFEGERLDLGPDDHPFHVLGRVDHGANAV